ncbi:MAG: CCA tRNA nucleotidyltransferase, partial [bacterium]
MDPTQPETNPLNLDSQIYELLLSLRKSGGRPLLIGGWVRDRLLGITTGDLDIEVFNLPLEVLKQICRHHGRLITVGATFAVLKLTLRNGITIDISVPRRERQIGKGHKTFQIQADPFMTIEEAAQRRDLTINAISMDPFSATLIDP